jgi:hypothetical protein
LMSDVVVVVVVVIVSFSSEVVIAEINVDILCCRRKFNVTSVDIIVLAVVAVAVVVIDDSEALRVDILLSIAENASQYTMLMTANTATGKYICMLD